MPLRDCPPITAAELSAQPLFADDPEALDWLAAHFEAVCLERDEVFVREGDAADRFFVVLDGEIHFRRGNDPYGQTYVRTTGQPSGVLPFSRMKIYRGRGSAARPTRLASMDVAHLRELIYRAPNLAQKLVADMTDRTRESTQVDERRNKMLALGKLSAGLAHELNNPAAALVSSSARLREVLMERRRAATAMRGTPLSQEAQNLIHGLGEKIAECRDQDEADALELADRAQDFADWIAGQGVEVSSEVADALAGAGLTVADVAPLLPHLNAANLGRGLLVLACDSQLLCLSREVEEAARRVSDLVQAVKSYSYMDQTPLTRVRIEDGLKVTLRMFQHQLKHGVQVVKSLAPGLPLIEANGSELNQIWTNLIDNALDAMSEAPAGERRLEIRTALEPEHVLVEIADSGPGIPGDILGRIFDPFFTTKPVGEGTGLGLDIVHRIVTKHKGTIQVESAPGRTAFQVRLPL